MKDSDKSKPHRQNPPSARPPIKAELLDEVLKDYANPEDLIGPDGLLRELTAALVNRAMEAELTHHLGYEHGERAPQDQTNRRNGTGTKRVRTERGPMEVRVPRDREGRRVSEFLCRGPSVRVHE